MRTSEGSSSTSIAGGRGVEVRGKRSATQNKGGSPRSGSRSAREAAAAPSGSSKARYVSEENEMRAAGEAHARERATDKSVRLAAPAHPQAARSSNGSAHGGYDRETEKRRRPVEIRTGDAGREARTGDAGHRRSPLTPQRDGRARARAEKSYTFDSDDEDAI